MPLNFVRIVLEDQHIEEVEDTLHAQQTKTLSTTSTSVIGTGWNISFSTPWASAHLLSSRTHAPFAGRQAQHDQGSPVRLAVCNSRHQCRVHPGQLSALLGKQRRLGAFRERDPTAMPSSPVQRAPTPEYLNTVEREEELGRLRNQARIRKSLLVHGSEGVGKSRLLQTFVGSQPLAVYIPQMRSPREFVMTLIQALHSADGKVKLPENIADLSTSSLKGIVHRALDTRPFLMVLDHLDAPSRVVTGMIKDLHYYGRTPVIFASRSPHMEDIGALRPLCANKAERLEVKNFPPQVA